MAETGLPGRPSTGTPPSGASWPNSSGLPGRMAICQKSSVMPRLCRPSMTRSWSPTEAPPVVTSMSMPATASATAAIASRVVRGDRQHDRLAARGAHQRGQRVRVGADDAARRDRLARHGDLVAGGQDGDARAAVHAEPGMVGGGGEADVARGDPAAGRHHGVAARRNPGRRGGCGGRR